MKTLGYTVQMSYICGKFVDPHFPGCRIAWVGEVVALAFVAVSIFAAAERMIRKVAKFSAVDSRSKV